MTKFQASVAFRLALGYGALVVATMVVLSAVLYFGTVFMIDREIDAKLSKISQELTDQFETGRVQSLQRRIEQLLNDAIDQDTGGLFTSRRLRTIDRGQCLCLGPRNAA